MDDFSYPMSETNEKGLQFHKIPTWKDACRKGRSFWAPNVKEDFVFIFVINHWCFIMTTFLYLVFLDATNIYLPDSL